MDTIKMNDALAKHINPEFKTKDEIKELIQSMDRDLQKLVGASANVMKKLNACRWGVISPAEMEMAIREINDKFNGQSDEGN